MKSRGVLYMHWVSLPSVRVARAGLILNFVCPWNRRSVLLHLKYIFEWDVLNGISEARRLSRVLSTANNFWRKLGVRFAMWIAMPPATTKWRGMGDWPPPGKLYCFKANFLQFYVHLSNIPKSWALIWSSTYTCQTFRSSSLLPVTGMNCKNRWSWRLLSPSPTSNICYLSS